MDLPATGPSSCPSVYSFAYGNVGVISLDANELSREIQGLLGYSKGAQVRWLEARLAAWRRDPFLGQAHGRGTRAPCPPALRAAAGSACAAAPRG